MSFSSVRVGAPVTQQIISGSRASCISNCRRLPFPVRLHRPKRLLDDDARGSEVTPELAYCPPVSIGAYSSKKTTYRLLSLQDIENKGDNLQDPQNAGVIVALELWSFGRHKPGAGGFRLDLVLII